MIPVVDMIVQLLICYICFTLGASDQLTRFDCFLIEDAQGNFIVKYKLKEGVPQAIGEAYVAEVPLEESEQDEEEDNSFTNESLWRDRHRGQSLVNERACDLIMQQFFTASFNQSMILPETCEEPSLQYRVNPSTEYGSEVD